MEKIHVRSVSEFLDTYKKFQPPIGKSLFLFRGVRNAEWKHIPVVFRQYSGPIKTKRHEVQVSGPMYASESEILSHFCKEAYGYFPNISPNDRVMWLEIAQHYGVPTRLLDFTENPLVALYFCCQQMDSEEGYVSIIHFFNFMQWSIFGDDLSALSVNTIISHIINDQIFHRSRPNEKMKVRPIVVTPTYIDNRMSAQSSKFMLWGSDYRALEDMIEENNYMMPFSENSKLGNGHERFFTKIYIDEDAKKKIMRELQLMNITEKTIFPGLDGIGKYIERTYRRGFHDPETLWPFSF